MDCYLLGVEATSQLRVERPCPLFGRHTPTSCLLFRNSLKLGVHGKPPLQFVVPVICQPPMIRSSALPEFPAKIFPFPERQFVHSFRYPHMVPNLIIRTISDRVIVCVVVAVVLVRVSKRVVRKQLQAVRESPVKFHLQRVVDAARVVAQIVALIRRAAHQDGTGIGVAAGYQKCQCR